MTKAWNKDHDPDCSTEDGYCPDTKDWTPHGHDSQRPLVEVAQYQELRTQKYRGRVKTIWFIALIRVWSMF